MPVSYRGGKAIGGPKTSIQLRTTYRGGKPITAVSPIAGVSTAKYRAVVPFMTASYVTAGMPGMTAKSIAMFTKAATMPSQLTHSERAFVRRHMPSMKPEYRKKFVEFERELTQAELKKKLAEKKGEIARPDIRRQVLPFRPGITTGLLYGVTPTTLKAVEKGWGVAKRVPITVISKAKEAWRWQPVAEREYERKHEVVTREMATWKRTPEGEPITPHKLVPKVKQLAVQHEELITKARERDWVTAEGTIEYPLTPKGKEWAREEREIAGRVEKFLTPEGYYREEYYVPTKKGAETIEKIEWLEERSKELAAPTVMAKERTKGMWVAPLVTKATGFGEWWERAIIPKVKEFGELSKSVYALQAERGMPSIFTGTMLLPKERPITPTFQIGMAKGIPDVPIMAAEVTYAGEYIARRPKEAAMIAPGVAAYMAKGMYKEVRERPIEFAGRTATMMAVTAGIGKASPLKMAKVDITPTIAWRGVGVVTPIKKTFHPIVGVKGRELTIGEPFKIPTVPKVTKIKGVEKVRVEIPPEGFEGIAAIRAGKMPKEVFLEPKAAAEMVSGIEIMRKHAKVKPEVKRPLREIHIERIPKKSMVEVEKILREHEHVVYGSAVQEMYLKKAPRKAHDIDIGIRKKDIPIVRGKLITTLEKEVGKGKVRRAPTGEGIEVLTEKGWRHAVDIHPLSWQEAFHEAPPFGVKLRPWEKVNGITTISLGEQWVKKGTTWLVPEYAKAGKLGVKTEWRLKDVPDWSKISRDIEASIVESAEAATLFKPLKKAKARVLGRELEKIRVLEKEKYPEVSAFFSGVPYSPYARTLIPLRKFPHKIKGIYLPIGAVPSYEPSYVPSRALPSDYMPPVSKSEFEPYPSRVPPYVSPKEVPKEAYPKREVTTYPKRVHYPKAIPYEKPKPYHKPTPIKYPKHVPHEYPKLVPYPKLVSYPTPTHREIPHYTPPPPPYVPPYTTKEPQLLKISIEEEPKRKKRVRTKRKPYAWRVKNPIPELQEMFAHEMHKRRLV